MNKQIKTASNERPTISPVELAQLGDGEVAYIKELTAKEAGKMFPAIAGIPKGIPLFALHAADGTPLALTDSRHAALNQASEEDLSIASVH
jgi:hypothetical protein